MNRIEDTLRDLPVILSDWTTEAVGLRTSQRDALARLCAAVRGDGFYEHLLAACDEASDVVVDVPSLDHVVGSAQLAALKRETA